MSDDHKIVISDQLYALLQPEANRRNITVDALVSRTMLAIFRAIKLGRLLPLDNSNPKDIHLHDPWIEHIERQQPIN